MTRGEFDVQNPAMECKWCHARALTREEPKQDFEGGGPVRCTTCGRQQFYLEKDRVEFHRPRLKNGTTTQVWAAWGGRCAHCNIDEEGITLLGLTKTTQHVPAHKNAGDAYFVPYCSWCQQRATTEMARIEALVARLAKRMELPG